MRKTTFTRIATLLLCLLTLTALLCLGVHAEEEYPTWSLSKDGLTLSCSNGKVYTAYQVDPGHFLNPRSIYEYANTVILPETAPEAGEECLLYSPAASREIVWIQTSKGDYLYVTELGRTALHQYVLGANSNIFRINDGSFSSIISLELLLQLVPVGGTRISMPITELADLYCYDITEHDATETLSRTLGLLIEDEDGAYYYLSYDELPSHVLNADGSFNFNAAGEVTIHPVAESLHAPLEEAIDDMDLRFEEYTYENPFADAVPIAFFWIVFVLIGFVAPLAFVVAGLILPHIGRLGRSKYWYIIAIAGGVWILLAALLMILLLTL
ncbi:MAG: hypothetical protein E7590_00465 [Ruminococcaceae bacterium]|nr:hypothetical protein [Oscillospiraceae bacterium]